MNKVVTEGRHLLVCVCGGGELFLPSYATPARRMSRCRCCEISSNTARLRKRIQVKMKKTLLQALKTLKTPRFLVTNNHVCVYVSPNVATSPVSSSGGAAWSSHDYLHTKTSWLSVQTLRICSSGTEVLLKSPGNNYEKNKGRYSHVGDTRKKMLG